VNFQAVVRFEIIEAVDIGPEFQIEPLLTVLDWSELFTRIESLRWRRYCCGALKFCLSRKDKSERRIKSWYTAEERFYQSSKL
jgi:hypothetical protein